MKRVKLGTQRFAFSVMSFLLYLTFSYAILCISHLFPTAPVATRPQKGPKTVYKEACLCVSTQIVAPEHEYHQLELEGSLQAASQIVQKQVVFAQSRKHLK